MRQLVGEGTGGEGGVCPGGKCSGRGGCEGDDIITTVIVVAVSDGFVFRGVVAVGVVVAVADDAVVVVRDIVVIIFVGLRGGDFFVIGGRFKSREGGSVEAETATGEE